MNDDITNDNKPRRARLKQQSFLLKAGARTISAKAVARMSEEEAMAEVARLRWPETDGAPICPECGSFKCYDISTRSRFKCAACYRQFSITSGTTFHCRKLSYRDLLFVIVTFVNGVQGVSSLRMARDAGINPKSAFVLLHKLRSVIQDSRSEIVLGGEDTVVEMDVVNVGGAIRAGNTGRKGAELAKKEARRKSRKKQVMVAVQRQGGVIAAVVPKEDRESAIAVARKHIALGTVVMADEHKAYDALLVRHKMKRVNHQYEYANGDACTNNAENFNSRLRRAERGVYHRISSRYLESYVHEIAYRHSRRRTDNGTMFLEIIEMAARHPVSRQWKGYWQRYQAAA